MAGVEQSLDIILKGLQIHLNIVSMSQTITCCTLCSEGNGNASKYMVWISLGWFGVRIQGQNAVFIYGNCLNNRIPEVLKYPHDPDDERFY